MRMIMLREIMNGKSSDLEGWGSWVRSPWVDWIKGDGLIFIADEMACEVGMRAGSRFLQNIGRVDKGARGFQYKRMW